MSLFYFIKQNNTVGAAAHPINQLAAIVIADVAGWRSQNLGNAMLFHKFAHV